MMRVAFRLWASGLILAGLWMLLTQRHLASTAEQGSDLRAWVLVVLGALYFAAEYRLKMKADRRADRAEAREIELHRRRMDDKA